MNCRDDFNISLPRPIRPRREDKSSSPLRDLKTFFPFIGKMSSALASAISSELFLSYSTFFLVIDLLICYNRLEDLEKTNLLYNVRFNFDSMEERRKR
jgi:hypothetical protein